MHLPRAGRAISRDLVRWPGHEIASPEGRPRDLPKSRAARRDRTRRAVCLQRTASAQLSTGQHTQDVYTLQRLRHKHEQEMTVALSWCVRSLLHVVHVGHVVCCHCCDVPLRTPTAVESIAGTRRWRLVPLERTPAPFGATSACAHVVSLLLVGTPPMQLTGPDGRQRMETSKSAVGVAMQHLVLLDKVHDMHQRHVVDDEEFEFFRAWAVESAKLCCGTAPIRRYHTMGVE